MIAKSVIRTAELACRDSRSRFQAGDRTVSASEGAAILALIGALKAEGAFDPVAPLVIAAASGFVRTSHSPLEGRGLTSP